MRASVGAFRRV